MISQDEFKAKTGMICPHCRSEGPHTALIEDDNFVDGQYLCFLQCLECGLSYTSVFRPYHYLVGEANHQARLAPKQATAMVEAG